MPPSYLTPKGFKHEVNGESLTFYPLSVGQNFRLKEIARPLGRAIAILLSDNAGDRGSVSREWKGPSAKPVRDERGKPTSEWEGETESEYTRTPPPLEVAALRSKERDDAVQGLIDVVTEKKNVEQIAEIIKDSLREEKELTVQDLCRVDLVTLWQLLKGVMKANAQAMPPLSGRVREKLGTLTPKDESGSTSSATPTGTAG